MPVKKTYPCWPGIPSSERFETVIRHLNWMVKACMFFIPAALLPGICLLCVSWVKGKALLPEIYIPQELPGYFAGMLLPGTPIEATIYPFLLWFFVVFSGLFLFDIMICITACLWYGIQGKSYKAPDCSRVVPELFLIIPGLSAVFLVRGAELPEPPQVPAQQVLQEAVENNDHDKVRTILTRKNLQNSPAGELLLVQIALRNNRDLPRERYERALAAKHLAVKPDSAADGYLSFALEYRLYGHAVSSVARQVEEGRTKRTVSSLVGLACAIAAMFCLAFLWHRIHVLRRYAKHIPAQWHITGKYPTIF